VVWLPRSSHSFWPILSARNQAELRIGRVDVSMAALASLRSGRASARGVTCKSRSFANGGDFCVVPPAAAENDWQRRLFVSYAEIEALQLRKLWRNPPRKELGGDFLGRQIEEFVDELVLPTGHACRGPTAPAASGSCGSPRIPQSFGAPLEIHESSAWLSPGV